MADTKISALTVATTPLAGTEVLPIVQGGVTKQVSVADLTAGRAVSAASLTLTTALTAANGGTGQSSYVVGDLLYASGTTALSKLADVATGNALISGGVGVAPSWGKIGLTTHVSGVLPVANGGTNASSASITAFNNITGYTASGATGTTSTNLVFSTSPTLTTPKATTTIGVGNATPAASGSGVSFPATQSASSDANTLDDYEEGVYTTGMTADGGTVTLTYDKLNYTKTGRMVTVSGEITIASVSSPTGDIYLNLPFTAETSPTGRSGFWSSYLGVAYTFTGTPGGPMVGLFTSSATKMIIRVGNNAGGAVASGFLTTNTTFDFGFTYQAAG